MTHQRYNDTERLISDIDQLQLTNETEVMIYREDRQHEEIVVDLGGQKEQFEELKTLIAFQDHLFWCVRTQNLMLFFKWQMVI